MSDVVYVSVGIVCAMTDVVHSLALLVEKEAEKRAETAAKSRPPRRS